MAENLITKKAAADLLGVSLSTVDRMIREGELTAKKYGTLPQHPVRLDEQEVRKLKKNRPPAPAIPRRTRKDYGR